MSGSMRWRDACLSAAAFLLLSTSSVAQSAIGDCTADAMLVFDGSTSMAETGFNGLDRPRIEDARGALRRILPHVAPLRRMGLITYGPGGDDRCRNVNLLLPPTPDAADRIIAEVESLIPDGNTPLTRAVRKAADTLALTGDGGTVVLVTDGKENCGDAPCAYAEALASASPDVTVHVIGFQVRDQKFNWNTMNGAAMTHGKIRARCLADLTGGEYVSTETADQLAAALQRTLGCPMLGDRSIPTNGHGVSAAARALTASSAVKFASRNF